MLTDKQMRGPHRDNNSELSQKCRWLFMSMTADEGPQRRTKDQTNDRDNLRFKAEQIILQSDM